MSGDEDDKATVVIDLNALKKEKERKEKEIAEMAVDLEFATDASDPAAAQAKPKSASAPVLLFDFGGSFFTEHKAHIPTDLDTKLVTGLPDLNNWLKKKTPLVVVFAFEANPKAVNQLCAQLKAKFKHVRTVIVAKNLSPDKVKLHQASPAAAAAYVKVPFTKDEFKKALTTALSQAS